MMGRQIILAFIATLCNTLEGHNFTLQGGILANKCFLSQKKTEILSNTKNLQQISVKKLDKINIQLLFKDCRENNYFLFCFNKEYLPLSFFPLSQIKLYFFLPTNLTSSLLLLNIFKSHKNIIFKEHNSFFLFQSECVNIQTNFASKSPFQENKVRKCIFTHF